METKEIDGFLNDVTRSVGDWSESKTMGQSQVSLLEVPSDCVWWQGGTFVTFTKASGERHTPNREDLHPKYKRKSRMNPKLAFRFILVPIP
ncbi:hypothetical protein [Leptospira jelokensis]|uniref:hypothetical protein n=1 Tax=Leptospira jelokensis TaxID=2484931 RepID=UPI001ABF2797|nr:hypothetical protein [Leptospira jelokensis]